jgi:hypothetical protein
VQALSGATIVGVDTDLTTAVAHLGRQRVAEVEEVFDREAGTEPRLN